jgi:cyanophycin synthetase
MMADYCDAKHILYVTMSPEHTLVKQHINLGGRAVVLEKGMNGDMITIYDNGTHIPLLWSHLVRATMEGRALHNVQNAMFAAAMAYSFDVDLDKIRDGLRTFNTSFFQAPGRMNVYDEHPFRVILDYAHNAAAFAAMSNLVDQLDVQGKRVAVVACPGDRRDEDIIDSAATLAGHFDHYICKADDNRRRRGVDEVPQMMRAALIDNGVSEDAIEVIPDEQEAVMAGLDHSSAGDLLVVFGDNISRCWKQIIYYGGEDGQTREDTADVKPLVSAAYEDLIEDDQKLISDDRGVRLARDDVEDGD